MKSLRKYLKKEEKLLERQWHLAFGVNGCNDENKLPELKKVNEKLIKIRAKILLSIRQELEVRDTVHTPPNFFDGHITLSQIDSTLFTIPYTSGFSLEDIISTGKVQYKIVGVWGKNEKFILELVG